MKKKYVFITISLIAIIIIIAVAAFILLQKSAESTKIEYGNDALVSAPVVSFPGERGRISNYEFDYSYAIPDGYLNTDIHFEDPDNTLGMQKSELIYNNVPRKVNYQIGGITIDVYNINKLKNNNLKNWIQDQTESESTNTKIYVTDSIKSIRGDDIYVLINKNVQFANGLNPAMFIKTRDHIYTLTQNSDIDFTIFKNIAFSLIVGKERLRISDAEYTLLNSFLTIEKTGYTFSNYPVSFEYPNDVIIKESSDKVELTYKGSIMTITPNQHGIGFEDPVPEEVVLPISNYGKQLTINNKPINRTQLFFKQDNLTTDLILIPYSDTDIRGYSVMINYKFKTNFTDQEAVNTFDRIVASFKVG